MKAFSPLILTVALTASSSALPVADPGIGISHVSNFRCPDEDLYNPLGCHPRYPGDIVYKRSNTGLNKRSPEMKVYDIPDGISPQDYIDRVALAYRYGGPAMAEVAVLVQWLEFREALDRLPAKLDQDLEKPGADPHKRLSKLAQLAREQLDTGEKPQTE